MYPWTDISATTLSPLYASSGKHEKRGGSCTRSTFHAERVLAGWPRKHIRSAKSSGERSGNQGAKRFGILHQRLHAWKIRQGETLEVYPKIPKRRPKDLRGDSQNFHFCTNLSENRKISHHFFTQKIEIIKWSSQIPTKFFIGNVFLDSVVCFLQNIFDYDKIYDLIIFVFGNETLPTPFAQAYTS